MTDPVLPLFEPGHVIDGKYRVERVLGQGGMGIVYEAYHQNLAQSVALKVVLPEIGRNAEALARFMNEARNSARIESDHVARIMDTGCFQDGTPFIVMELLVGKDLEAVLAEEVSMPAWRVADLLLEALDGMAAAHSLGIVHRDLKPANLFLAQKPGRPARVKVLDFGISKALASSPMGSHQVTRTSAIVGSPAYISPEQLRNSKDVDARADIWSLGVIAYQLATGVLPFEADNVGALFASIIESEPPPMRTHRADVPPELERIVVRCIRKRPEERFQTVIDLAMALAPLGTKTAERALDRLSGGSISAVTASAGVPKSSPRLDAFAATHISDSHLETLQQTPAQLRPGHALGKTGGSWVVQGDRREARSAKPWWLLGAGLALLLVTVLGAVGIRMYTATNPKSSTASTASTSGGVGAVGAALSGPPSAAGAKGVPSEQAAQSSPLRASASASSSASAGPLGSASAAPRAKGRAVGSSENPDDLFGRF